MRNVWVAYIIGVVQAGIALIGAFGFELSGEQTAGIVGFITALSTLVLAINDNLRKPKP